jgi:hypothetical protein
VLPDAVAPSPASRPKHFARRTFHPEVVAKNDLTIGAELVKDPYAVLRQKEQDIARVRKEIRALLTVIPLLTESPPSWPEVRSQIEMSRPMGKCDEEAWDNGLGDLERYFPFISRLQQSR